MMYPIIGLTATATEKVQEDILKNLAMSDAKTFKASFNRRIYFMKFVLKPLMLKKTLFDLFVIIKENRVLFIA